MYLECISCPKMGISCDGPNFVAMSATELLEWCKSRKAHMGLSNGRLSELSGMPKGTIDRLFAGQHVDFRYETIRPLIKALTGGQWSGSPCPDPHDNDMEALKEKAERLARNNMLLQEHIDRDNAQHQKQLEFLREQIKHEQANGDGYKKTVFGLSVTVGIVILLIIAALIIDRVNPEIGFFWLEEAFSNPMYYNKIT